MSIRRPLRNILKPVNIAAALFSLAVAFPTCWANDSDEIIQAIDARQQQNTAIAKQLWDYAEISFQEEHSSKLLQQELKNEGFSLERGVAGMPTAFIASYGKGGPVIAILAEFDALPGISQDATPERKILEHKHAGHACGHNLFGAGVSGVLSLYPVLAVC